MSLHLHATRMYCITEPGTVKDHDGKSYQCPDIKHGDVIAYDKDDNIYKYVGVDFGKEKYKAGSWPSISNGTIRLWRDQWRVISTPPHTSPYHASIATAAKIQIKALREAV